ncbi:bifunctional polysaccharide deacetylase/glycosyltransferase family 2 protein [Allokutzneria oryzae]|uniref:Bifunctional polysaccharide deacetylase/glycosyltransferase family 2 protein n=1 Tax=Allokutzneria oryzae TaxID=1378989 RepID=A0ABV5ZZI2_9PSEU
MATERRTPRTHWALLAVTLLVLLGGILLDTLVLQGIDGGARITKDAAANVPASVSSGGPLLGRDEHGLASRRVPDHTIALTFDDGPDPVWTPAVLDVLRRNEVHATFFVTGAAVSRNPSVAKQIVDAGHEIGLHTFTHTDLSQAGPLRTRLELDQTRLVVAGATDRSSRLVRPPYSARPEDLDDADFRAVNGLIDSGYVAALSDLDSKDWMRPGVDAIVKAATPQDNRGAVVLMHDSGGDRAQTVAALEKLIPSLRQRGWHFSTLGGVLPSAAPTYASWGERTQGSAILLTTSAAHALNSIMGWLVIVCTLLALVRAVLLLGCAMVHSRRKKLSRRDDQPYRRPVTVLVPAYNEEAGIEATLRSILASTTPVRVIVIDDGSTDGTADVVRRLRLPDVRLIRQDNAGKAAALNTGLGYCQTELVVMVDGDTVLEPDTVSELVRPFTDPVVGAVSGNAKVGNRSGLLGTWQHIEYVIGFNLDRRMYDVMQCMPTVPGAVGAFRMSALLQVDGIPMDTLAEDTDLTMALERAGWAVTYQESARAWTEVPASLGQLWRQRYRWCYGTLQAMWKHRGAVRERGLGGRLGRRGLPYLLLYQVLLPLLAPAVDVFALVSLFSQPMLGAVAWIGFFALQLVPALVAFWLDRERFRPLWTLVLQPVVYRQLMYLVVIQSVVTACTGARLPWQKLHRTGSAAQDSPLTVSSASGQ